MWWWLLTVLIQGCLEFKEMAMRAMQALCLAVMAVTLNGCGLFGQISEIPDEDLASYVRIGAEQATRYGVKMAMDKDVANAAGIAKSATLASEIIRKNVLPVFSGAETQEVLRSAVDTALAQLSEKLSPIVISAVQLALNVVTSQVKLPANPADKLPARTKAALAGFFDGAASGLDQAVAAVATREIGPPKLTWPKGK